jgi:hypothetical protein
VVDHRCVGEHGALAKRQQFVQPQSGKAIGSDGGQVGAASLDPEHANRPLEVIRLIELARGVATTPVRKPPVGAEQV